MGLEHDAQHGAAHAGRSHRRHHAVERPLYAVHVEVRTSARGWQHRGLEAGGVVTPELLVLDGPRERRGLSTGRL